MNANFPFTAEQKEYLSGFFAGANQRGFMPFLGKTAEGTYTANPNGAGSAAVEMVYGTPVEDLCKEERIKFEKHGLDCYEDIRAAAASNTLPTGADLFRFKFYGLFNVTPAQESLMLRCRIPAGIMMSHQLEGMAEMAEDWAGGYAHITTRANFQLREIQPKDAVKVLDKLVDIGFTSRGAGADNLRNITGSSTAGFDPDEFIDVRPLAKAMHHIILNTREFYNLPRKFNISFDGGGALSVCADTNDIAFYAVRVGEGQSVEPGVYFRVQLAGITGHKQFAKDCGILVKPEQCIATAAAMIRVFVENGNRSARGKARLKYLIDQWGDQKFVEESEKKLDFDFHRLPLEKCQTRRVARRHGHVGVYPQKQEGLSYVGVEIPVGKMLPGQMKAIAALSRRYGQGEIRLTVWQNLLIPHVRNEDVEALKKEIAAIGFRCETDHIRGGLVACTGNFGCKYASADTKSNAVELGDYLAARVVLDRPLNIHVTGCAHSCAQHYIGDIGMQSVAVKTENGPVEGYHVVLGGGGEDEQGIAKDVFQSVAFEDLKPLVENILKVYLAKREGSESFIEFNRRHDADTLRALYRPGAAKA